MENVFEKLFHNGSISIEQDLKRGVYTGSIGVQVLTKDEKLWLCIDGQAVIRYQPNPLKAKVLACPFCGNKPNGPNSNGEEWYIECGLCLFVMEDISQAELINRWNTRNGKKI